jgi:hypothetical protein
VTGFVLGFVWGGVLYCLFLGLGLSSLEKGQRGRTVFECISFAMQTSLAAGMASIPWMSSLLTNH